MLIFHQRVKVVTNKVQLLNIIIINLSKLLFTSPYTN